MDPDQNYADQKRLYGSRDPSDKARLRELVAALRGWVSAGGFRPKGYVGPAWKPAKDAPSMTIKKVGGAQAESARGIGLIKIDKASAERLYNHGADIVIVGDKVGAHAFFKGWAVAFTFSNKGRSAGDFARTVNSFGAHLEPELGRHPAFFVSKADYEKATGKRG